MASFEDRLEIACKKLGLTYTLKEKQLETLEQLYVGKDCISVLPTGYGKSTVYQQLPWLMQKDKKQALPLWFVP
jgi:superfamily II DNA helicase RecQ